MTARGPAGIRGILDTSTDFCGFPIWSIPKKQLGVETQSMTRPAGTYARSAPPQAPAEKRDLSLRHMLADPRARLGVSIATLLATAGAVRRDRVGPGESMAFRAVNGLPDSLYPPAWAVMQLGAFGAVPAAAATAWLAGEDDLAGRLLAGGTGAWALSKLVKQAVRRPRPTALLPGARCRGRDAAGSGTCPGTPPSPSPSASQPCPGSARRAAFSP
jgi:hypothetical protein